MAKTPETPQPQPEKPTETTQPQNPTIRDIKDEVETDLETEDHRWIDENMREVPPLP